MNYEDLCDSIAEAERFIRKAKAAKKAFIFINEAKFPYWSSCDGKANGACTRASMDLTRSLANLRHPWRKK